MRRLFVQIYAGIAAVLIVGTIASAYLLSVGLEAFRREAMAERLTETVLSIRNRLEDEGPDRFEWTARDLARAFRLPLRVLSADSVGAETVGRLDDRQAALVEEGPWAGHVVARLSDGRILVAGWRPFRPGGGPWGPRGGRWFRNEGPRPGPPGEGPIGRPFPSGEDGPQRPPFSAMEPFWRVSEPFGRGTALMMAIIALPLLLVAPAVFLMIRPLERRVRALADAAERFGEGDLQTRAVVDARDALSGLAGSFNLMAERIEGLVTGQKELLRAVSHELRTPLARVFFILDNADAAPGAAEKNEHLRRAGAALADLNDLVEELLTFVRLDTETVEAMKEPTDAAAVLADVAAVGRDLRAEVAVEVAPTDVRVRAVPPYFRRAVLNLVTNAVRHAAGRVRVACAVEGPWVEVMVDDDGPGVPPEFRERVFEPFTRVDTSRSAEAGGAGLGLAIVARIVALHGGEAAALGGPDGGARFRLRFPKG